VTMRSGYLPNRLRPASASSLVAPRSFQDILDRHEIPSEDLHPVVRTIVDRASQGVPNSDGFADGKRLGLVVEGGAMRGIVSLGMLVLLEQLGASSVFDDIYGSSAGAINSAFFIGGQAGMAATVYYNEMLTRGFISYPRHLVRRPIVSVEYLLDQVVDSEKPLDWEGVANARTRLHPIAFSTTRLDAVDLSPLESKLDVKEALRASARVPIFSGPPVTFRGDTYFDATMTRSIPYENAVQDQCTHVLVLRTRPLGTYRSSPSFIEKAITEPGLRKLDRRLIDIFHSRADRYREEVDDLESRAADPSETPHLLQVAPGSSDAVVGSLTRSRAAVLGGAMTGMRAASRTLLGTDCRPLEELRAFYSIG
jgi:predicted patatin/cPLA2 family phospholipase